MLYRIPWWWIQAALSPWVVTLAKVLLTRRKTLYSNSHQMLIIVRSCFPLHNGRCPTCLQLAAWFPQRMVHIKNGVLVCCGLVRHLAMIVFLSTFCGGIPLLLNTHISCIPPTKNNMYLSPLSNTEDSGGKGLLRSTEWVTRETIINYPMWKNSEGQKPWLPLYPCRLYAQCVTLFLAIKCCHIGFGLSRTPWSPLKLKGLFQEQFLTLQRTSTIEPFKDYGHPSLVAFLSLLSILWTLNREFLQGREWGDE